RRRRLDPAAVCGDLERQCGRGTGQHDHHAARVRDEQQGCQDLGRDAGPPDPAVMPMSLLRLSGAALLAAAVAGCAMIPPAPIVTGPVTAPPPAPPPPSAQPNGSIYQPRVYGNYPLFEDRRPRNVGDIVTIVLNEKTNAAKNVATTTERSGSAGLTVAAAPGFMDSWANAKLDSDLSGANESAGR